MSAEPIARGMPAHPILHQYWRDAVFLHWRVDPASVTPLVPADVRPDIYDGAAWVGLVAFELERSSEPPVPLAPWLGSTVEVSVRIHTIDDAGRRGTVLRALDATRLAPVIAANARAALPYRWSAARHRHRGDVVAYAARRRMGMRRPRTLVRVCTSLESRTRDPLAQFLTARWGVHVPGRSGTQYWRTEHGPWPLYRADEVLLRDELVAASGLRGIVRRAPESALYSPGVETRFATAVRG